LSPAEERLRETREQTSLTVVILASGIGEALKSAAHYEESVKFILDEANRLLPSAIQASLEADKRYMDTFRRRRLRRTSVRLRARTRKARKPRKTAKKSANKKGN
jgi:hypothetical protein